MFAYLDIPLISPVSRRRGILFGSMIVLALFAFEVFNFSTTEFALDDLVGDLNFIGLGWATILAIAFCGIDFAGIARLFTPEEGDQEPAESWYLFAAWLLAATMNALLTWWGVSLAILNQPELGNEIVDRGMLLRIVPVFIAVMVWLIRILIIGTFALAGERLFSQADAREPNPRRMTRGSLDPGYRTDYQPNAPATLRESPVGFQPAPKPGMPQREPTYRPESLHARGRE
jgi:hypothetical protein